MQAANQHLVMEYAPSDLRSPSPTSSVGSRHPQDQTSISDSEMVLSHTQFESKWQHKIGLGQLTPQELRSIVDPLLARPPPNSEEERNLYERVVYNLRREVHELNENDLFEQTLLQGSKVALETPVYTKDIDSIMRSMMIPHSPASQHSHLNHTSPSSHASAHGSPTAAHSSRTGRASTYHPNTSVHMTNGPWNDTETTRGGFGAGMDAFVGVAPTGGAGVVIPPPGTGVVRRRTKGKGSSRR